MPDIWAKQVYAMVLWWRSRKAGIAFVDPATSTRTLQSQRLQKFLIGKMECFGSDFSFSTSSITPISVFPTITVPTRRLDRSFIRNSHQPVSLVQVSEVTRPRDWFS